MKTSEARTDPRRRAPRALGLLGLLGLSWIGAGGCGAPPEEAAGAAATEVTQEGPPSYEALRAEAIRLPDGRLIIDQDILVADEAAARAYYDRSVGAAAARGVKQQGLTVNQQGGVDTLWPLGQRMELTYCVDAASFGSNAAVLLQTLEAATYSWSRRVGIAFRRVDVPSCSQSTTQVVFNVRRMALGGAFASAFFPNDGRADRELLIDNSAFTTTAGGRDLLGILSHELGHTLGARHEHIWLAAACTGETTSNARQVTPYDVNSVMHYPQCRPSGGGGYRQSEQDYGGMNTLYGLAPALILTHHS